MSLFPQRHYVFSKEIFMSNKTGFFAFCKECGAGLRSRQRLENHKKSRCNARNWPRNRRPQDRVENRT
jgi:hypothetical protein